MIVVDANVVAYLLIDGEKTAMAQEVYRRDSDWIVPPIFEHEFANIVATYAKRDGGPFARYRALLKSAYSRVRGTSESMDLAAVLEEALRLDLSAYDAEYAYIALSSGIPLVTEDRRLLRAMQNAAFSMSDFVEKQEPA